MYAGAAGRRGGGLHQYGRRPSHARVSAKKHSNSSAATTSNNSIAASASTSRWNNDETTFWFWHATISNQLYHTQFNSILTSRCCNVKLLNEPHFDLNQLIFSSAVHFSAQQQPQSRKSHIASSALLRQPRAGCRPPISSPQPCWMRCTFQQRQLYYNIPRTT